MNSPLEIIERTVCRTENHHVFKFFRRLTVIVVCKSVCTLQTRAAHTSLSSLWIDTLWLQITAAINKWSIIKHISSALHCVWTEPSVFCRWFLNSLSVKLFIPSVYYPIRDECILGFYYWTCFYWSEGVMKFVKAQQDDVALMLYFVFLKCFYM